MEIMAAFESFLDFFFTGFGSIEVGDGAREGKNGLQGGKGPPQRFMFPVNAVAGNFDRDAGIEPLRLLFETLNETRLSGLMLGRVPEKLLFSKKRPVK